MAAPQGDLHIFYTNADQLSNKMDLLKARIEDNRPDIICINEVNPNNPRFKPLPAEFSLDESYGYDFKPNNIGENGMRGQVMMCKSALDAKQVYFDTQTTKRRTIIVAQQLVPFPEIF